MAHLLPTVPPVLHCTRKEITAQTKNNVCLWYLLRTVLYILIKRLMRRQKKEIFALLTISPRSAREVDLQQSSFLQKQTYAMRLIYDIKDNINYRFLGCMLSLWIFINTLEKFSLDIIKECASLLIESFSVRIAGNEKKWDIWNNKTTVIVLITDRHGTLLEDTTSGFLQELAGNRFPLPCPALLSTRDLRIWNIQIGLSFKYRGLCWLMKGLFRDRSLEQVCRQ